MRRALGLLWVLLWPACVGDHSTDVDKLTQASLASGVMPEVLARGTFGAFNVRSSPPSGDFKFEAKAKPGVDLVVRRHEYGVGAHTGWHRHPGPVFITVIAGTLTFYEYDDPNCTPIVVSGPHGGYVDTGRGHIARNESGMPATDISVITAPVGQVFRSELEAPGPHCGF